MSQRCTICLELADVQLAVTREYGTCWLCTECDEREFPNETPIVEGR